MMEYDSAEDWVLATGALLKNLEIAFTRLTKLARLRFDSENYHRQMLTIY